MTSKTLTTSNETRLEWTNTQPTWKNVFTRAPSSKMDKFTKAPWGPSQAISVIDILTLYTCMCKDWRVHLRLTRSFWPLLVPCDDFFYILHNVYLVFQGASTSKGTSRASALTSTFLVTWLGYRSGIVKHKLFPPRMTESNLTWFHYNTTFGLIRRDLTDSQWSASVRGVDWHRATRLASQQNLEVGWAS
jgi:hypothetical protein